MLMGRKNINRSNPLVLYSMENKGCGLEYKILGTQMVAFLRTQSMGLSYPYFAIVKSYGLYCRLTMGALMIFHYDYDNFSMLWAYTSLGDMVLIFYFSGELQLHSQMHCCRFGWRLNGFKPSHMMIHALDVRRRDEVSFSVG